MKYKLPNEETTTDPIKYCEAHLEIQKMIFRYYKHPHLFLIRVNNVYYTKFELKIPKDKYKLFLYLSAITNNMGYIHRYLLEQWRKDS